MNFDTAHRHQQALDPSALTTIRTTLHAIEQGIIDCRNAGVDPDTDPAVVLLARHLAVVSSNRASEAVLQAACRRRLGDIERFPALLALAIGGVAYDAAAKDRFHKDGRKALRLLAQALTLAPDSHTVSSWMGDASQSGAVTLVSRVLSVTLRVGGLHEGREVSYRAIKGGVEQAPHFAAVRVLLDPQRFADRLRRELMVPAIEETPAQKLLTA
ncbi:MULTISPECIES: hypothetical protein [unclassified Sphingomonas]|uniref:hypothetical protein n=1 Tax=unclassified Sphingomonas TaxID=196159 RepID=UPI002269A627|nr:MULTISPECIES: hypothetical protein [unclassified Sphingomonas]